jgi:dolichol-phosphate mannosyltransferase
VKRVTSNLFYTIINKISDIHIEQGSADFRLMDRKVVDQLKKLPEKDKFYRGLVNWIGFKSTSIDYTAAQRVHGSTSYTWKKMLNFGRIGITSFSMLPMKMIFVLGSILFLGGSLALAAMLYVKYVIDSSYFSGTAILVMIILANNGIIIMAIGIISIYSMTMFKELKDRPNYIVSETLNV